jgi:hypothetical protein
MHSRRLLQVVFPVVERQARGAERLIAQVAMPGMCIAQASTAIGAFCHSIAVARIADGVLEICHFDNSANVFSHAALFDFLAGRRNQSTLVGRQRLPE